MPVESDDRDSTAIVTTGKQECPVALVRKAAVAKPIHDAKGQVAAQIHTVQAIVFKRPLREYGTVIEKFRALGCGADEPLSFVLHHTANHLLVVKVNIGTKRGVFRQFTAGHFGWYVYEQFARVI